MHSTTNSQIGKYRVLYTEPETLGKRIVGLDILTGKLIVGDPEEIQSRDAEEVALGTKRMEEALAKLFGQDSTPPTSDAKVAICDIPFSETGTVKYTCYERVTGYFPQCSENIESRPFMRKGLVKLGRALLPKIDLASAYVVIGTIAALTSGLGKRTLYLGGTHSITYPIFSAASRAFDDLALVWVDAHTDMYHERDMESYDASRFSDGNVLSRILKARPDISKKTFLVGTRLIGKEYERHIGRDQVFSMEEIERRGIDSLARDIAERLQGKKIYLSIDMDAVDPAFAPAVNTPIAAGLTSHQILKLVNLICKNNMVFGGDIVEIDPAKDEMSQTCLLAARIAVELLVGMQNRN